MDNQPQEQNESLFENYKPRSISTIRSQQRALIESQAAEAAGVILDGVEPAVFDESDEEFEYGYIPDHGHSTLLGQSHLNSSPRIRIQRTSLPQQLSSPGAQFVYALLIFTGLAGLMGLAATIESPMLVLSVGIASPILLPICVWKWIRWLDSKPYYYQLLSSLGEDARNLLGHRLLWKRS